MKPFSMHAVLDYRQRLEDIAKNNMGKAQQAEQIARAELQANQDEHRALIEFIERIQYDGVEITELIRYEEHLAVLKARVTQLSEQLAKKHEAVEQARRQLLEKSRERQAIEKLKEKQDAAWKQYLNKKEAAVLDEIAIIFNEKKD